MVERVPSSGAPNQRMNSTMLGPAVVIGLAAKGVELERRYGYRWKEVMRKHVRVPPRGGDQKVGQALLRAGLDAVGSSRAEQHKLTLELNRAARQARAEVRRAAADSANFKKIETGEAFSLQRKRTKDMAWLDLVQDVGRQVQINGSRILSYAALKAQYGEADPNDALYADIPEDTWKDVESHGRVLKSPRKRGRQPQQIRPTKGGSRSGPFTGAGPTDFIDSSNEGEIQRYLEAVKSKRYANTQQEAEAEDLIAWWRLVDKDSVPFSEPLAMVNTMLAKANAIRNAIAEDAWTRNATGGMDVKGKLLWHAFQAVQHNALTYMQHLYAEFLKRKLLTGITFSAWGQGFMEQAKRFYELTAQGHEELDRILKELAHEMRNEWIGAMGTKPAYTTYWFYGVVWQPLSLPGQRTRDKMDRVFKVNKDNAGGPKWLGGAGKGDPKALAGWRGTNRMFYMMSGALRDSIIVKKESVSGKAASWSVGLDPQKMHNKVDSHGRLRGLAVNRRYTGEHRTAGYSTYEGYKEVDVTKKGGDTARVPVVPGVEKISAKALATNARKRYKTQTDFLAANPTGKSLDQLMAQEAGRRRAMKPGNTKNAMYQHLMRASGAAKYYANEPVIQWKHVKYEDDDPAYKASMALMREAGSILPRKRKKIYMDNLRGQRKFFRDMAAKGHGARVTSSDYTGTIPTILQKFIWNEYGFSAMKSRRASIVGKGGKDVGFTQRGAVVMRPLFGPLANEFTNRFYNRVLSGVSKVGRSVGVPLEGGTFGLYSQGVQGTQTTSPWTGYSKSSETDPLRNNRTRRSAFSSDRMPFSGDAGPATWAAARQRYRDLIKGK